MCRVLVHSSGDQRMSEKSAAQTEHANRSPSNSIFVGQKPVMNYVTAIIMGLTSSNKQYHEPSKYLMLATLSVVIATVLLPKHLCSNRDFFDGKFSFEEAPTGNFNNVYHRGDGSSSGLQYHFFIASGEAHDDCSNIAHHWFLPHEYVV